MPTGTESMIASPTIASLGPDDTGSSDLAAIRRLLEAETSLVAALSGTTCPSCDMPFDKGKKRRLIDQCGHERCYSCMFRNESCPICVRAAPPQGPDITRITTISPSPIAPSPCRASLGSARGSRGSEITLYDGEGSDSLPARLPRPRPPDRRQSIMTQSCPTPPQSRRRFFLSPKALRSSLAPPRSSKLPSGGAGALTPTHHMSASVTERSVPRPAMTSSSCSEGRNWPSFVLAKIRSLWSADTSSADAGLNQLVADDEGGDVSVGGGKQPTAAKSQTDLYMRLGLLLGGARNGPKPRTVTESCSSLASFDAAAAASANTSPVSTLTGSSEEPHRHNPGSDMSVASLVSGRSSNCSSSPVDSRRNSAQRRSATRVPSSTPSSACPTPGAINASATIRQRRYDPSPSRASRPTPQLTLKPLFFEVPQQESEPAFVGRQWLVQDMEEMLEATSTAGMLISGEPGTGKTALMLQLVEHSCFGRRGAGGGGSGGGSGIAASTVSLRQPSQHLARLASNVVAYHFCQADNNATCLVPDFVHSLAAQLCQAPRLVAYRDCLLGEPHLQRAVSLRECIADPDTALVRGVLEPLAGLRRLGKIENKNCLVLVDGLCEAEYHRPDAGDTVASFLAKHSAAFPAWLKVIATVRTQLLDAVRRLSYTPASLDEPAAGDPTGNVRRDLLEYVTGRVSASAAVQSNAGGGNHQQQQRFCQHVAGLGRGCFLFAKLTLDLLERGHLVAKSSGYKVLPVSLGQIYLLHFNLRFPTVRSWEKVAGVLAVCLSALYPLTLLEIYYSVNALRTATFLPWDEFLQRFRLLSGFLVKRLDNTYMFFHPSFREWLMRRDDGDQAKFVCDLRTGHAAIALRLARVQAPLDAEKTLELGHHILKAHVYRGTGSGHYSTDLVPASRDLQAMWVACSSADVSAALCSVRNVYSPNVKVSRLLLLAGASPDRRSELLGEAPVLCMHANEGCVPMTSLLLEFAAHVDLANSQGSTALALAAARGHCDVVRRLVAAGASPGRPDTSGRCPLVHASVGGHLNVVGYLLACDWLICAPEDVCLTDAAQQALVAASTHGHTDIIEYLLDMAEVRVDSVDALTGETALTAAASAGKQTSCSALLGRGAGVAVCNTRDTAPLLVAVREGHWAVAERLLQAHAPLEQCDGTGRTALMLAAAEGHVGLLELLLDKGARPDGQDRDGLSALCWACLRGRVQAAQCLVDRGADVNRADRTGRTPLDLAAFHGSPALVQMLLDRGALIEHVDINGMRPLDRAIGCRNVQVVQCFLRKGAKLGPATWAMAAGKPDITLVLLNKLLEDGNVLYRKGRLKEAAHRYQYALKKLPGGADGGDEDCGGPAFQQLRVNFLLNQSRCKRKMNETEEAVELAGQVLAARPDSYEAYYARAKARLDARHYDLALVDVREALRLAPAAATDVRRVLTYLRDDVMRRLGTAANQD